MGCKPKTDRNEVLFQRYIDVLHSYGTLARDIKKRTIYDEVGKPFFLEPQTVGIIIGKMLKDKSRREIIQRDDNLSWLLEELESISETVK